MSRGSASRAACEGAGAAEAEDAARAPDAGALRDQIDVADRPEVVQPPALDRPDRALEPSDRDVLDDREAGRVSARAVLRLIVPAERGERADQAIVHRPQRRRLL